MKWLLLFGGGGIGAVLRYVATGLVDRQAGPPFPWGTLAVNVAGCLAIGLLVTLIEERGALSPSLRLFFVTGLLGGFTTFSTFGIETWQLLEEGHYWLALANPLASVGLGLTGVIVGVLIGRELV